MTASEMLKLMNRATFASFDIYMNDGHRLSVEQPYQISTVPNSPCCTVYDMAGEMHIVSFRNITRIVTAQETTQSA